MRAIPILILATILFPIPAPAQGVIERDSVCDVVRRSISVRRLKFGIYVERSGAGITK